MRNRVMRHRTTLASAIVGAFTFVALAAAQAPVLSPPLPPPPSAPMPQILRDYKPVTAERLKNPDASDWLMVRRTWDGWGYSPLDQITPANVGRLQPAWVVSSGV